MLRPFTIDDAKHLTSWVRNAEELFQFSGPTWSFPLEQKVLEDYLNKHNTRYLFIFEHDSIPYGFGELITNEDNSPRLSRLIISPEYRGKGLGAQMIAEIEEKCIQLTHSNDISLFVLSNNDHAIKCYKNCGFDFVEYQTFSLTFEGIEYPVLKMAKPLRKRVPTLETERLILREPRESDVEMLYQMRSNPETMKYIPRPLSTQHADALKLIHAQINGFKNGESISWGITKKGEDILIGTIGFVRMKLEHNRAELGYMLHEDYHRQGIMSEAATAVINYGFNNMKLHTIEAIIDAQNTASGNLLITLGFEQEAYFKEDFLFNGVYRDSIHYTIFEPTTYPSR